MKAKEIIELIDFIAQSPLDEVNIETDEFKISVKRSSGKVLVENMQPQVVLQQAPQQALAPLEQAPQKENKAESKQEAQPAANATANYLTIKSPMIGTFYRAPDPNSPSFVNIGDEVKVGQPVCIIEAMKLFNEIESEVAGRIVKVLVENASPVEYDQPLFLVEPL